VNCIVWWGHGEVAACRPQAAGWRHAPWRCGHLALGLPGHGIGQAMHTCPGAGSAQPWALGADPRTWLQP